jgi:hypothetical protein
MKYLTVCRRALLALSLAVVSTSAFAGDYGDGGGQTAGGYGGQRDCYKCPPPRNYDSQEVVKKTRDVDHTRVIETQSVVPSKRLIETNHLIVHENETRNVGTVEHNHTIIEKELVLTKRNVDNKYVNTVVNLVEHKYNTQRQHIVEERELPGEVRDLRECNCDRPLQTYGMATQGANAYGSAPKYVKSRH